jgi:small GTP-binding protein
MKKKNQMIELKMILLGESGVGKTSIINRYFHDKFESNMTSTLSMSYVDKELTIGNKKIKLNIWDTIGQEKYRSISKLFLNETKIVLLVYDITNLDSFKELDYWHNLCKESLDNTTILGIAGNKEDLYLQQKVKDDEAEEYAKKCGAMFTKLSCKENKHLLDEFINSLVEEYLKRNNHIESDNDKDGNRGIKLDGKNSNNNVSESGGCCGGKKSKNQKYESIKKDNGNLNSIFLGDNGVGKTSIIKRIEGRKIDEKEKHTESATDHIIKHKDIILRIFDIDNDKNKSKEVVDIIMNSKIFFLVYNVRDKITFNNVGFWIENINNYKKENKDKGNYLFVIIGNKNDEESKEKLKEEEGIIINEEVEKIYIEEGQQLANENNGIFFSSSALKNTGLNNILEKTVEKYLKL